MSSTDMSEYVAMMTSMGFDELDCVDALQITSGNVEMAINHLLSSGVDDGGSLHVDLPVTATAADPTDERSIPNNVTAIACGVLRGNTSQYDNPDGRSACTCIALTAAGFFLSDQTVTSSFLDRTIQDGVKNYWILMTGSAGGTTRTTGSVGGHSLSGVEHLSAEEVLNLDDGGTLFPVQVLSGGIRQGVLSHDIGHPLGMHVLLNAIRQEQPVDQWICVLVTKTPESVLVCLPPPRKKLSSESSTPEANAFWLIDSHPRPQLGLTSSYAKLHPTLDTLLLSLSAIFPPTQIDGVPEMMAVMYNSFDLYPLRKR